MKQGGTHMREYAFTDAPFQIFGVPFFAEHRQIRRLPDQLIAQLPAPFTDWNLGRRCPGARLGFRTDAAEFSVRIEFETFSPDIGMSIWAAQSANVFIGPRQQARYAGLVMPQEGYKTPVASGKFSKAAVMEDVEILLPRNEIIKNVTVSLPEDARVEPPTPYRPLKPLLFYGSSITEGGCCSKPANAYNALLSRWLNWDYYNMGFSGSAKGEEIMADYLNAIEKGGFILDYDYNAPNADHLRRTHAPFFRRIREHDPDMPILILSRPSTYAHEAQEERDIIQKTYLDAVAAGDKKVWFLDGGQFFGSSDREACTVDCVHPTDLGMYRMAKAILPVLQKWLPQEDSIAK